MSHGSTVNATSTGISHVAPINHCRLLYSMFATTKYWGRYDPFFRQKDEAFRSSKDGVLELAERFRQVATSAGGRSPAWDSAKDRVIFVRPPKSLRTVLTLILCRKKWCTFVYGATPRIFHFLCKRMQKNCTKRVTARMQIIKLL